MSGMRELEVIGECPKVFRAGMHDNLVVTAWFGRLDKNSVPVFVRVTRDVLKRLGDARATSVHLFDRRAGLPERDTRDALVELMKETGQFTCLPVIVSGTGFWASAFRSFITGVRVLGPRSYNIHEHATVAAAVEWIPAQHQRLTGVAIDPLQLEYLLSTAKRWQDEEAWSRR